MSRRDKSRLAAFGLWGLCIVAITVVVVVGVAIRDWEHHRIAELVVERMRAGGGR